MKFVFFTFRDFTREGGGTIRMYGVLNALAEKGHDVVFISNARDHRKFHPTIHHIFLNLKFSKKALFQGFLAVMPSWLVYAVFRKVLGKVSLTINKVVDSNTRVVFFEYLDNSVGYLLKKRKKINSYINDIHGISTIEFRYQKQQTDSFLKRNILGLKYNLANLLDKKVFESADGLIYSSNAMKIFFEKKYHLEEVRAFVLPNLLSKYALTNKIDSNNVDRLRQQYRIDPEEKVLLFAGGYKNTAGVDDLVNVFEKLNLQQENLKLILIGEGPTKQEIIQLVKKLNLSSKIIFIDRIPYDELQNYQALADIIVCPDKMNEFSDLIIHLKYLDSLLSEKIVINGSFKSVLEINSNENLSLNFVPSDQLDLYDKISYALHHQNELMEKFSGARNFALHHLTYESHIDLLTR